MHSILRQDADTSHNKTTQQPGSNGIQASAYSMWKSGEMDGLERLMPMALALASAGGHTR